jgi:hypothetical protein
MVIRVGYVAPPYSGLASFRELGATKLHTTRLGALKGVTGPRGDYGPLFLRKRSEQVHQTWLDAPSGQSGLSAHWVILDPIDSLPGEAGDPSNIADAIRFAQQRARVLELLSAVARLTSLIGARVSIGLCVRNASALGFLRGLGLSLRSRSHERDQRVTDCALHGLLGGSVKRNAVDHRSDHDAPLHELANGLANVLVVAAKAINPANHQRVARPQYVEQPPSLWSLRKLRADPGDPFVPYDLVEPEAGFLGLGALVLDGLLSGADAGVENCSHVNPPLSPLGLRPLITGPLDSCQP